MLTRQMIDKLHQIALEVLDFAVGHEAEDVHLPILAVIQLPARSCQGDCRNGTSGGADRSRATKSTEPDHDFVLGRARCAGRGEEVIGYIGNHVGSGV